MIDKRIIQAAAKEMNIKAYCLTCGQVFLEINAKEYLEKTTHFKDGSPDKWFVETGIHWCENEYHQIIMDCGVFQQNVNEIWEEKRLKDGLTKEIMLPNFYKYRENCKDKTI